MIASQDASGEALDEVIQETASSSSPSFSPPQILSDGVSQEVVTALKKLGSEINDLSTNLYNQHQLVDEDSLLSRGTLDSQGNYIYSI